MKPLSLHATLAEQNRIRDLFTRSNLFLDIVERIKDGSLYLPPSGFTVERHCRPHLTYSHGLRGGYGHLTDNSHRLELLLAIVGYDEGEGDTVERQTTTDLCIPVELVDSYTITTEPYGHPANKMTREVMTFAYSKRAFAAWVKKERVRLRSSRKETLTKERAKLDAQIKALS